ncbi:hypothetical protein [Spirosoma koreense]
MKMLTIVLLGASLLALSGHAYSQDQRSDGTNKPLNNPMYSTSNYKHPNMAAAARRWEKKEGVPVRKPSPNDAQLANYKNQMPVAQPAGGVTVDHTPSASLADRNYKIQRVSEPASSSAGNEYLVKKQKRKADSTTIGE